MRSHLCNDLLQAGPVPGADLKAADVGAVNRQAGNDFADDFLQLFSGDIPGLPILFRQQAQHISQGFQFPLEQAFHDQLFLLINQLGPGQVRFDKALIDLLNLLESLRLDEKPVEGIEKIIAGSARHRPLGRQGFVRGEDLFHHHIETFLALRGLPAGGQAALQALQISQGVI